MRLSLILLLLVAACASPSANPSPGGASPGAFPSPASFVGAHEAARVEELRWSGYFWDVPHPLPDGQRGQLLRVGLWESGSGARMYRAMYLSTSVDGVTPVAVTGTVWVPQTPPPPDGFPILAWGPGFTGVGDDCAPSRHPDRNDYRDLFFALVAEGFVVASTDYEGHGTRSPYLDGIGESGSHSLLDSARAAQDLLGSEASDRVVIAGHSLGGDIASAAQIWAPAYADELDIRGVVSIESLGDFERLAGGSPDPNRIGVFLLLRGVRAMAIAYPELRPADVLTPYGVELLGTLHEEGCEPFPDLDSVPNADAQKVDLMAVESWAGRFRSQTATQAPYPVFYVMAENGNGLADNVRVAADRLCQGADHVLFRVYPETDHESVVEVAYPDYMAWLRDRLATDDPFDGCEF